MLLGQHPVHDPPDVIRHPLDQKMNVVCHQTVGVEKKGELLFLDGEQREKLFVIFR